MSLFDAHREPLLRYVCAFGFAIDEAEDLVQDVFLALFAHLRRGGARANLPGWLFRVARNLALKRRAKRRRERDRWHAGEPQADMLFDRSHNPEEHLTDRERRRRLHAVLGAMPERDRQCVSLRGHGLRYREIALVLGISLGAVAQSLSRALARLQRATGGIR